MRTLTTLADVEGISFGDQFVIEPASWPGADDESQEITEQMLADRDAIVEAVNAAVTATPDDKPADDIERIRDDYTVGELKKLATEHKIDGRSKLTRQDDLIDALLAAGVEL